MMADTFSEKLKEYSPGNALEQEHVLAEILQHFILSSLAKSGLFRLAGFYGGTFLRIIHGLDRFSEDLDFVCKAEENKFHWQPYLDRLFEDMTHENIKLEVLERSASETAAKKAFVKAESKGKLLLLDLPYSRHPLQKIKIKLEIDTRPPQDSTFDTSYIAFPVMTAITTQTLESAFASKAHALLCRSYTKGRDWYDFLWYVAKKVRPNLKLLSSAIEQQGPWQGQGIKTTEAWFIDKLRDEIGRIDWKQTREDVIRFLPKEKQASLSLWTTDFFLYHAEQLARSLN